MPYHPSSEADAREQRRLEGVKVYRYQALFEMSIVCDARTPEEARKIAEEEVARIVDGYDSDAVVDVSHFDLTKEIAAEVGDYPKLCEEDEHGDLYEVKTDAEDA